MWALQERGEPPMWAQVLVRTRTAAPHEDRGRCHDDVGAGHPKSTPMLATGNDAGLTESPGHPARDPVRTRDEILRENGSFV